MLSGRLYMWQHGERDDEVVSVVKKSCKPETERRGRSTIPGLSTSGVIAPLEISKPVVPSVSLASDKVGQLAHAAFTGTAEV